MHYSENERRDCNPAVQHAFCLLSACSADRYETDDAALEEARGLTRLQIRDSREPTCFGLKHWLHVYAVLNREQGGHC